MRKIRAAGPVLAACLCACQSGGGGGIALSSQNAALPVMERISTAAQQCWFRSKAPEFADYRLSDELNSYSGRPRLLLVPARHPEALPLLVIHASGDPARVEAFGPLMDKPAGKRIATDLKRWTGGSTSCGGAA